MKVGTLWIHMEKKSTYFPGIKDFTGSDASLFFLRCSLDARQILGGDAILPYFGTII
jgi:hypothetical protein